MSLLEDIFLADEATEAQELERVIDGDEYDERPRALSSNESDDDGGNRSDEAEEDKRRVDPTSTKTKKVTKNPRFILNPARLTGPRGIQIIPEHFKDFKFKGKGHEKEDLDMVLKKLEHWAYRLYPKFQFEDCLKKIETLGKKRPVMVHLHKIRTDQFMSEETVVQKDSSDDEQPQEQDEFDKLLQQQIELARATPAPGSVKKVVGKEDVNQWARVMETPNRDVRTHLPMPKATSSPSISDEQKERMIRNRKLAEERRLARLKQATNIDNTPTTIIEIDETEVLENNDKINDGNTTISKKNKSNVIDSSDSDDECNVTAVNESIAVDIHSSNVKEKVDESSAKGQVKISDDNDQIVDDQSNRVDKIDDVEEVDKISDVVEDIINDNDDIVHDQSGRDEIKDIEDISDKVDTEEMTIENDENDSNREMGNTDQINTTNHEVEDDKISSPSNEENVQKHLLANRDNEINTEVTQPSEDVTEFAEDMDVDFSDDF